MKAVVAPFNQEKALVGAFSVITNLRMDLIEALESREQRRWWSNLVKDPLNLIFLRCVILSYQVSQLNCKLKFVDIICL